MGKRASHLAGVGIVVGLYAGTVLVADRHYTGAWVAFTGVGVLFLALVIGAGK